MVWYSYKVLLLFEKNFFCKQPCGEGRNYCPHFRHQGPERSHNEYVAETVPKPESLTPGLLVTEGGVWSLGWLHCGSWLAQRGRLRSVGSLLPILGFGPLSDFLPLLFPDTFIPERTHACTHVHTQTHTRKENKWLPKPMLRAFFGLSAILVLSPLGSLITGGIQGLFFWGVVDTEPPAAREGDS